MSTEDERREGRTAVIALLQTLKTINWDDGYRRQQGSSQVRNSSGRRFARKRVIDSEAFAALPASAVVVLLLLARNLEKGKNGHVFVSTEDAERHGVERKTLYRQLRTLATAGFVFPTTRGGNGRCTKFALT